MPRRNRPRSACSEMNLRLSYAWPLDGTYAVASAMPVATWRMKARRVALPKTYHHPVRGGTGCASARRAALRRPLRSSIQAKNCLITSGSGDRDRAGLDLDLTAAYPPRIGGERLGRRPRRDRSVGVVHAA